MPISLNLSLAKKVLILVFLPVFFELSFLGALYIMLEQAEGERLRETHAREVAGQVNALLRLILEAGTSSVLSYMTNSNSYYRRYRQLTENFNAQANILRDLVHDNEHERTVYSRMAAINLRIMEELKGTDQSFKQGDKTASMALWLQMQSELAELFKLADQLVEEQQVLQKAKITSQAHYREQVKALIVVAALLNVILAVLLALYVNRGSTRRLKNLVENTQRLASNQPLNESVPGDNDEIFALDRAFRSMAKALAEALSKERAVLENAADVICTIDHEGRFITVNPATLAHWGYSPDELLGLRLTFLLPVDQVEKTLAAVQTMGRGKGSGSFEAVIKRKNGLLSQTLWLVQWSENEKALFCVVRDITESRRIENLKQEFVTMVSHDLRTPLTSVRGFLSLLSANAYAELNAHGQESLAMAEQNVDRVINLVNDILDVERLKAGQLSFEIKDIALDPLLRDCLNVVAKTADDKSIALRYASSNFLTVHADAERVIQVVLNLLSNAIKFSSVGKTVEVVTSALPGEVEVSVIDQGRGVPKELREEIFERFRQVLVADGKKRSGIGLGLAISKTLIEQQGGTIGVDDGPGGKGSRFWFRLPDGKRVD